MKNSVDLLAHLRESEVATKDWPNWKKDIWPDVSRIPDYGSSPVSNTVAHKGNLFAELANFKRYKATI